jgi:hypothetical protein
LEDLRKPSAEVLIPAISVLVPDVVFTIGYGGVVQRHSVGSIGISTNLLGSAAGSAFDALGSQDLANYFKGNVAISTGIPTKGDGKISSALGLGLGSIKPSIRSFKIGLWPVLGIQEFDSADARLSTDVKKVQPDQSTWSQLTLGIGVPIANIDDVQKKVECGKLVPILSIGVGLPYYYPGDSFTSIAAVFTKSHNQFVHVRGSSLLLALDVPLLKVGSSPPQGIDCSKV